MLKIFKSFNPQTVILLMLFAIVIKMGYFIYPPMVHIQADQWGFAWIMKIIYQIFGSNAYLMVFLGIANLVLQALMVNRLASEYKLFQTTSFVPSALFLIISSLIPSWNTLSAPLLANWFILFTINNLLRLPFTATPSKLLFNSGMFVSLAAIIYYPSIIMLIFIIWALLILQTFKVKDLIITILGFITPIYFVVGICYVMDYPLSQFAMPKIGLQSINSLKIFPSDTWTAIGIIGTLGLLSVVYLNTALNKQVESGKKMWWIVITALILANVVSLFQVSGENAFWYFSIAPISLLATNIWMADNNKWVKIALFWILLATVIYIQYL